MAQSEPLYQRIAAGLREQIRTGQIKAGERLPTEQDLMADHGVSRNTVRLALGMLQNEGMVTSTPGRGTIVRERIMADYHATWAESRDRRASDQADAFQSEMAEQGRHAEYRDFAMSLEVAGPDFSKRLQVAEGEPVVSRGFIRYADNQPLSLQTSYYPMDIAREAGLVVPNDVAGGAIRAMAAVGHEEIGYRDEITARMPTPDEARKLQLGSGTPVIIYARTTFSDKRPLRLTLTTFASDRNRVIYELGDMRAYLAQEDADA
ncbi:GntR family transcriptional regulator [Kribbella sancticallisti]|uniref:GntR family transcriptional regulator n=1 Tax=Kribbella sancticallisti TaxID=460087 RepID=A0ABN2ED08_9ACTN